MIGPLKKNRDGLETLAKALEGTNEDKECSCPDKEQRQKTMVDVEKYLAIQSALRSRIGPHPGDLLQRVRDLL